MAAELTTIKLNAEQHLLLDQPLLRMPYELSRKNFKTAQRLIDNETKHTTSSLKSILVNLSKASQTPDGQAPSPAIPALDNMITRLNGLKRKLETLQADDQKIRAHNRARLSHLQQLYDIPSLADVKYDEWSRIRLNRLLVDYLLRSGYGESAKALAKEKGIEELVDLDAFAVCHRIEGSLRGGSVQQALAWCADNKQALKKINSNLEYELRLQQYIEMVRAGKHADALVYARKYLTSHSELKHPMRAAVLLCYPPDTPIEPYATLYSPSRWADLATLFLRTHHDLYSLPPRPLLHIALSAGLSALKTPSCHSEFASSTSNARNTLTSVCPICSTELNELARNVPYAHHSKSYVENDLVVLPNGRIYGRDRLVKINEKLGTPVGKIRDPTDDVLFEESEMKKVFIS